MSGEMSVLSSLLPSKLSAQDGPQDLVTIGPPCAELTYSPSQQSLPEACLALRPTGFAGLNAVSMQILHALPSLL